MKKSVIAVIGWLMMIRTAQASFVLNEFYASPPPGEDEWIEVYNDTAESASFAGWQIAELYRGEISNQEGVAAENLDIPAHGFLRIVPSKLTLNNGGDTIYLLDPAGMIADVVTYPKLTATQTYARIPDGGTTWEKMTPTPALANGAQVNFGVESHEASASVITSGAGKQDGNQEKTENNPETATPGMTVTSVAVSANDKNDLTNKQEDNTISTGKTNTNSTTSKTATTKTDTTTSSQANASKTTTSSTNTALTATSKSSAENEKEAAAANDKSWQEGISFVVPRLVRQTPQSVTVPSSQPQVLGASTSVPMATSSARTAVIDDKPPVWALVGLILAGGGGSVIMIWWAWLEYAGGRQIIEEWLASPEEF